MTRSASRVLREVRIRVPTFSVVYFSRGTLPQKRGKRAPMGDLDGNPTTKPTKQIQKAMELDGWEPPSPILAWPPPTAPAAREGGPSWCSISWAPFHRGVSTFVRTADPRFKSILRSSSREVRIRVPTFFGNLILVGEPSPKKRVKGNYWVKGQPPPRPKRCSQKEEVPQDKGTNKRLVARSRVCPEIGSVLGIARQKPIFW